MQRPIRAIDAPKGTRADHTALAEGTLTPAGTVGS